MRRPTATVLMVVAVLVGPRPSPVRAAEPIAHPKLSREIGLGQVPERDRIPVIVHVEAPAATEVALSARPGPADDVRTAAVERALGPPLSRLRAAAGPEDFVESRRFALQPAFAAEVSRTGLETLLADPAVRYIEPDRSYTVHTEEGLQVIGATELHALGFTGEGTAVAIIDTGIDYHHPTLGGAAIPSPKVVRGLDTADLDDDPMDCGAHGTAVASVAAGTSYQWNPQRRFAGGVAPQAAILAYKASPDADCGGFSQSAVIAAIEDAVLHRSGEDYQLAAINLSFGSGEFAGPCDAQASSWAAAVGAATQAGIAVVASAGNSGLATAMASPACMADVISVGSVWDTEPGLISFSFCLDPECFNVCNDSFHPAQSVICYSNAGTVLDLYAPSEYLRAARAGDETAEFGGTSGAAAYVTGALALLRQAEPELAPGAARRLLQLTGVPTLDRRSGLVRSAVHLARALDGAGSVQSSAAPAVPIPDLTGVPTVSMLQIDRSALIGSVRVLLNLVHPDPTELRIRLTSPDGTSVLLHDRTPGTVVGGGAPVGSAAVWGVYPDEIEPRQSLGIFAGLDMSGTWTLEVFDEVPGDGSAPAGSLAGWALRIHEMEPPQQDASEAVTIPVAAHLFGERGTIWSSNLRILNPSPEQAAEGRLHLISSTADEVRRIRQSELMVPPRSVVQLEDVLARRFAADNERGALRFESELGDLIATSRTFTADQDGGSYGQYIGPTCDHHSTALAEPALALLHLTDGTDFRTNVGFTEIGGGAATVELTVVDGSLGGVPVHVSRFQIEPFSNHQTPLGVNTESARWYATARVVEGDGRIAAYASVVDNVTGDAVFVPAIRPAATEGLILPVVARTSGLAGTQWATELRIVNLGEQPTLLTMEFRPRLGAAGDRIEVERSVAPGDVLAVTDVVLDLLDRSDAVGSLRVTPAGGAAVLGSTARVYNSSNGGSYGQLVAVPDGGTGGRAAVIHADASAATRTNLGVCEVAGDSVVVRATVRDAYGRPLGEPLMLSLVPYQLAQVNDVFAAVGLSWAANAWVELERVAGSGRFIGYGSMVDAVTGDAIFVPSRPLPEPDPPLPQSVR